MHCLLCKKTQLSKNNRGKSTIFATNVTRYFKNTVSLARILDATFKIFYKEEFFYINIV